MALYYVNKLAQANGDHEVHREWCGFMPDRKNRIFLGDFPDCRSAVRAAIRRYPRADGCFYCSKPCHRR